MIELQSPQDTKGFLPVTVEGLEGWRDPQGQVWVRARADEPAELQIRFSVPGLAPVRLVREGESKAVKTVTRKARRAARELRKRGWS